MGTHWHGLGGFLPLEKIKHVKVQYKHKCDNCREHGAASNIRQLLLNADDEEGLCPWRIFRQRPPMAVILITVMQDA